MASNPVATPTFGWVPDQEGFKRVVMSTGLWARSDMTFSLGVLWVDIAKNLPRWTPMRLRKALKDKGTEMQLAAYRSQFELAWDWVEARGFGPDCGGLNGGQ